MKTVLGRMCFKHERREETQTITTRLRDKHKITNNKHIAYTYFIVGVELLSIKYKHGEPILLRI